MAVIVFYDNFESYAYAGVGNLQSGGSVTNWVPPSYPASPWVLASGTIDLIKYPNPWGLTPSFGTGLLDGGVTFLDMDGSTREGGTLMSIALDSIGGVTASPGPFIPLVSGQTYKLEFIMSGNQRSGSDTADIGVVLGNNGTETVLLSTTLAPSAPWAVYSTTFKFNSGDQIFFRNLGGDNVGVLLDNVKISVVPEPASLAVLGLGLAGLALRRKYMVRLGK